MTTPSRAILMVGAFPYPLGQGTQVYAGGMARALARRGHRVWFATYPRGEGTWPEGVEPVPLPPWPFPQPDGSGPHPTKPFLDAWLAVGIARLLRRERVDLVHAHHVEAPLAAWLGQALARRRVPVVYNLHTSLEEELPTWWRTGLGGRVAAPLGRAVDRVVSRGADGAVGLSARAVDVLRHAGARHVVHAPPGVDLAELQGGDAERARQRWSLGSRPWVVYTGNVDPYQDLDVLVDAVASLDDAGLLVVTGGDPSDLQARARGLGLPEARQRWVRSTDFADVLDAIAAGTVGALPRAVCAGFPIKLLNLLGGGLPVVAARGSAQPIDGVVAVPDHDAAAMAAALASLVDHPQRAREEGRRAAAAVAAAWTWDARAAQLEPLYDRVS